MSIGVGQRLQAAGKKTVGVMAKLIPPMVGREELADAIGYVENNGVPTSVTPDFIGQLLFDTAGSDFYIAFGVASGNWTPLAPDSLSLAELGFLDGAVAGTNTASKALVVDALKQVDTLGVTTIFGVAAGQGLAVTITGGTSSTTGNAGGVVALVGGTPGATGIGGAVTITGAAGGATSGAGGAVSSIGGVGTAGNAAGGAIVNTGGAGQGSAAGGAAGLTGGVGGATGAGGAIAITSGAGGGTSGASGTLTIASGTTTSGASGNVTIGSGNATGGVPGTTTVQSGAAQTAATAGGAIAITAGTGNTSGAGGAVTITSGAAGNTGVAGAIAITVGAATAGNGSAITLTGGNGAGSTNAGGNVNVIPGTAVSTGIPGEFQVNSVSGTTDAVWQQYLPASVPVSGTSYTFFMANRAYRVKAASCSCSSTATVPTVDITKDTGTTAPGAGTSVLTGAMSFNTTANTRTVGTVSGTIATITLAAGDRLAAKFGGTVGSITGAVVTATLVPA